VVQPGWGIAKPLITILDGRHSFHYDKESSSNKHVKAEDLYIETTVKAR